MLKKDYGPLDRFVDKCPFAVLAQFAVRGLIGDQVAGRLRWGHIGRHLQEHFVLGCRQPQSESCATLWRIRC